jgi:two-component system, NarL family, nitrate/nitrite response regulator NarL
LTAGGAPRRRATHGRSGLGTFLNPAVYAAAFASGARMPVSTASHPLGALGALGARLRHLSFMSSPIGVFIVSRNRLFADALALLLGKREELAVTGVAADPEAVAAGSNVLLIDATGDDREVGGALERLRGIRQRADGCKAIVLGLPQEDEQLIAFIEAGAHAYVLRGTSPADLVEAIRGAHAGRSRCSARVAAAVVARIVELESNQTKVESREREPLTAREREVLGWLATGRCNKEIGGRLHISVQTVKNHVHSILAKLGARRRREALRIAYEIGLLGDWGDPPPS